jgi:Pyruvate/2-oxoacid:ferredoxin oxidoreductase delta subunit
MNEDKILELRLRIDFWQPVNWTIEGDASTDCPVCRRKMIPIHSILQTNDQGFTPAVFGYCEGCGQLYLGRTK